ELMADVSQRGDADVADEVHRLVVRQILEEAEDGRLRFVHDQIRRVAFDLVPAGAQRDLHRRAAEAITSRHGDALDHRMAALGRHWEIAGNAARAFECYRAAARHAQDAYAHHEAER